MQQRGAGEELEERVELSVLYDFYGALLKEHQQRMFEASVLLDYNFAEIAEQEGISRQGAYDAIKRATKQLREYESRLGLVEKFQRQKALVQQVKDSLLQLETDGQTEKRRQIDELLEQLLED